MLNMMKKTTTAIRPARMASPAVPSFSSMRSMKGLGGSVRFSMEYSRGMELGRSAAAGRPAGPRCNDSRVGRGTGAGATGGLDGGGAGTGAGALAAGAVRAGGVVAGRESVGVGPEGGRGVSATECGEPFSRRSPCTTGLGRGANGDPGAGAPDAKGLKASITSAALPKRAVGAFCMSRSTTATNGAGVSGLSSLIGGGCLVWWAIIFSTAVPSGKGTWPVRQK